MSSMRSHYCGRLRLKDVDSKVVLCGWVHGLRDLGGLVLMDLRDSSGMVQLQLNQNMPENIRKQISRESVIKASGTLLARPQEAINTTMATGEVEVMVEDLEILNHAEELPFILDAKVQTKEALKLKYRYLHLRSHTLKSHLRKRARVCSVVRELLESEHFCEVTTPMLYKATPEGARDFLVPSRKHPHSAYALPQSPQTLKQLLMISGIERYYQIVTCFRDEDLRSDRQPEFTQIDLEASFVDEEWMHDLAQKICRSIWDTSSLKLKPLSYTDAMNWFGSDKPDLRYGLPAIDITSHLKDSAATSQSARTTIAPLEDILSHHSSKVIALFVPQKLTSFSRKDLDAILEFMPKNPYNKTFYFKSALKPAQDALSGGISKWIDKHLLEHMQKNCLEVHKKLKSLELHTASFMPSTQAELSEGVWFVMATKNSQDMPENLDKLRKYLANTEAIKAQKNASEDVFLWLHSFPLFDWNQETQSITAAHHPFTLPKHNDTQAFLELQPDALSMENTQGILSQAYDVVCNGYEIGGGSLRIFNANTQRHMLSLLGLSQQDINNQFGFLLEALQYGAPPHGGIAFGLERIMMLLLKTENIRDVIAFPKTTQGNCLMSGAPSLINPEDIKEWNLKSL